MTQDRRPVDEKRGEYLRLYREKNAEKISAKRKHRYQEHREEELAQARLYREQNREWDLKRKRIYYQENAEALREKARLHYENLSGYDYSRKRLLDRRIHGLARMKQRNERG